MFTKNYIKLVNRAILCAEAPREGWSRQPGTVRRGVPSWPPVCAVRTIGESLTRGITGAVNSVGKQYPEGHAKKQCEGTVRGNWP
jgi:hypothetical protein